MTDQTGAPADAATDPLAADPATADRDARRAEIANLQEQVTVLQNKIAELTAASFDSGHTDEDLRRIEHPEEFAIPEVETTTEPASDAAESTEPAEPAT